MKIKRSTLVAAIRSSLVNFVSLCSRIFEMLEKYFDKYLNMIPLSFILGFYVTIVAQRWWQQFMSLPWADT